MSMWLTNKQIILKASAHKDITKKDNKKKKLEMWKEHINDIKITDILLKSICTSLARRD